MPNGAYFLDQVAEFISGWIAGCAGVLVSHPFDTVRIRLQSQGVVPDSPLKYNGTIHCLVETVKKEKVYGLFKGITPPLLGTAAWNAVVFGVYGNVMRVLSEGKEQERPSFKNTIIASVAVAFAQSLIICPMELVKCRLQVQTNSSNRLYKGTLDCISKIYRSNGFRGLYRGMPATIIRDIPGFVSYFLSFEYLCRVIAGEEGAYLGPVALMLAGGTAGSISWTLAFPPDVIKTRIQIDTSKRYTGFLQCLRSSFKEEQWRLFVRGLTPTILRAFPMNAAIFTVHTMLSRMYAKYAMNDELNS
ncbi:mitochondrial basic amino acids transporter-like [Rhopilema esculentum]|uniref:mitochondrial basic amino acids transporter-like n=1 Tax=Rhopilema esculentum TaxID=499914 RepID=UPI0031D252CF|eukprot:gene3110-1405_t